MGNQRRVRTLTPGTDIQESAGGITIGSAFELLETSQVLFVVKGTCTGARYVQHELHLDNLNKGTSMQIAGAGLSHNSREDSQITAFLTLPRGAYRWTAKYVVFMPQGKIDDATQVGYAVVSEYPVKLQSFGINEIFSLVSGYDRQAINAAGTFKCLLPYGDWSTVQVSSTNLKNNFVIDTPIVEKQSRRQEIYGIQTQVLPFFFEKDTIFKVKLTVNTSTGADNMRGALLDIYS